MAEIRRRLEERDRKMDEELDFLLHPERTAEFKAKEERERLAKEEHVVLEKGENASRVFEANAECENNHERCI